MSVIKVLRDLDGLFNYSTDENPTSQQDYQKAVKNWVKTIVSLVDSNLWQPETKYTVGSQLLTPSLPYYVLRCTVAGTSDAAEPDYTDVALGDEITDGTVTWVVDGYLPLSGGRITGKILFDSSEGGISIASSKNEAGRLRLMGGSGYNKGAQLLLNGQSVSSNPGHFQLSATDATNTVSLYGFPDGRLTWAGKTVIVGTEATETFRIESINAGAQTSFSLAHTPRYYNVSLSGTGFANMLITKGGSNTFYVVNTGSQNRTNITVTVNYIY